MRGMLVALTVSLVAATTAPRDALAARNGIPHAGTSELRLGLPEPTLFGIGTGTDRVLGLYAGDPNTTFVMGLSGAYGRFVLDNVEVGGMLHLGVNSVHNGGTSFGFFLGPFGRLVFPLAGSFSGWAEAKLGFFFLRQSVPAFRGTASSNQPEFCTGASAGVDWALAPHVALYAGLGVDFYMGNAMIVPILITYGLRAYL